MHASAVTVSWTICIVCLGLGGQVTCIAEYDIKKEYIYKFNGTTALENGGNFSIKAQVSIIALQHPANLTQECRFVVDEYKLHVNGKPAEIYQAPKDAKDFSKWFSFEVTKEGIIEYVFYPEGEDLEVVTLKKNILGAFSAKLVNMSSINHRENKRWAYRVNETGHEGYHESTYQAESGPDGIKFTKTRHTRAIESSDHQHVKVLEYQKTLKVLRSVAVNEHFKTSSGKNSFPSSGSITSFSYDDMPDIVARGNSALSLLEVRSLGDSEYKAKLIRPTDLKSDYLKVHKPPTPITPLAEVVNKIPNEIKCIIQAYHKDRKSGIPCFRSLVMHLSALSKEDLQTITMSTLADADYNTRRVMTHALGAVATEASWTLLINNIILNSESPPELIKEALTSFIREDRKHPQVVLNTLETVVLSKPFFFTDNRVSREVNKVAVLVFGALIDYTKVYNPTWSFDMAKELKDMLGSHDPWHHRQLRSALSNEEFKDHLDTKTAQLFAMGNARTDSSLDCIFSYFNSTDTHAQLRSTAIDAYSQYHNEKVAQVLLETALDPSEDDDMRYLALRRYKTHKYGGDVTSLMEFMTGQRNDTGLAHAEQERVKRSLGSAVSRIWKGYRFNLKIPGFDWRQEIGGSKAGASFGLVIRNQLTVALEKLSARAEIDVRDAAWFIVNAGIIGKTFTVLDAEVCIRQKFEYDGNNLLKDLGMEGTQKLAQKFSGVATKTAFQIIDAVYGFTQLTKSVNNFDPAEIISNVKNACVALPDVVADLRSVGKRLHATLSKYKPDFSPVMARVRELVTRVTEVFNDIKTDVMRLYNSIVDMVTIHIPYAWNELTSALRDIGSAVKNIIRSPKTAIQSIGASISRIAAAVKIVLRSKDVILENDFFTEGKRPYWFDIGQLYTAISGDVSEVVMLLDEAVREQINSFDVDALTQEFTGGVNMTVLQQQALRELKSTILVEIEGPLINVKNVIEPFKDIYEILKELIKVVKQGWETVQNGFKDSRSDTTEVFGLKTHEKFPFDYLSSVRCGDGFYPSNGQGHYTHQGVDLVATIGSEIVSPFNGLVTRVEGRLVIIDMDDDEGVEAIIENISPRNDLEKEKIGAGEPIGSLLPPRRQSCVEGHVHVSLRRKGTDEYIDATKYLGEKGLTPPNDLDTCDLYKLVLLNKVIGTNPIIGKKDEKDKTPPITRAPEPNELDVETPPIPSTEKHGLFNKVGGFLSALNVPTKRNELNDALATSVTDISMDQLFDVADSLGLGDSKTKIQNLLSKVQDISLNARCVLPDSLDDNELRQELELWGKLTGGSRAELISRYKQSEQRCFGISMSGLSKGFCHFNEDCTAVFCCLEMELVSLLRYSLESSIYIDPCTNILHLTVNEWSIGFFVAEKLLPISGELDISLNVLGYGVTLKLVYEIKLDGNKLNISIDIAECARTSDQCLKHVQFLKDAQIPLLECKTRRKRSISDIKQEIVSRLTKGKEVIAMMQMKVSEVQELVDIRGLNDLDINELSQISRELLTSWIKDQIKNIIHQQLSNIFETKDVCSEGRQIDIGPTEITFFDYTSPPIPIGPLPPLYLRVAMYGYFGASFKASICTGSMTAKATFVPKIGSALYAALGIQILIFKAELGIKGYLLTTSLPTTVQVGFTKIPIDIRARMDLDLIPLEIQFKVNVRIEFKIFGLGVSITILDATIWGFQFPTIKKNIFNRNHAEKDNSAPEFKLYSQEAVKMDFNPMAKRSTSGNTQCIVKQISGLDHTEPAFKLAVGVDDDMSNVVMTYSVGTFPRGRDVVDDAPMGGDSLLLSKKLITGRKLYFTITASNSMGLKSHVYCDLPTYDMTPPGGRLGPEYRTTSNPTLLHGTLLVIEDSPVTLNQAAVGLGKGISDQVIKWHAVADLDNADRPPDVGDDPLGLRSLEYFTVPTVGGLSYVPFHAPSLQSAIACARECVKYPALKCQSFNYDYGASGRCELLEAVANDILQVHQKDEFHHFERKGVGHVSSLVYSDLDLRHDTMYYFNNFQQNSLGYRNTISSSGVLFDETPPNPGYLENVTEDVWSHEACTDFTPSHFQSRCAGETPLLNYRYIVDGQGSRTVFNGDKQLVDLIYHRSNTMVAGSWDGIHENETEILAISWGMGLTHCEDDIHEHRDPHAHLSSRLDWTHQGIIHPVFMPDGVYHITVRGINDIEYGGPMALAVCHSTPYIIDTTPPVVFSLSDIFYDEDEFQIGNNLNSSDDLSGILRVEFGLGTNPRNNYILDYVDIENYTEPSSSYQIPDGVPTWIKNRVTNHVILRTVEHADKPIVVDTSPPEPGVVLDGETRGIDLQFQSATDRYCGTWEGFHDPQSGISRYIAAVGSTPGESDIVPETILSPRELSFCRNGVNFVHKHVYYLSVTAYNGGINERNVTAISNGVYVDATEPVAGWSGDGLDPKNDMEFSSQSSTVSSVFGDFTDSESDVIKLRSDIYRKHDGLSEELVHTEDDLSPDAESLLLHHFHFHHKDQVRSEITAVNGAGSSVSVSTDGYTIDLTDPVLDGLSDGLNIENDPSYTSSLSTLSAVWKFHDDESGIVKQTVSVYQLFQGQRNQIYPDTGETDLPAISGSWEKSDFTLTIGLHYSIRVTAINGAGLTAVYDTTGVIVDPTPPIILYVHAGVLSGESEEVIDGYVIHNNHQSIQASWSGIDSESGILNYEVGIGTIQESTDILGYQAMGDTEDGILQGLNLQLTAVSGKLYYISVRATNGAGLISHSITSSPIKIVAGDVTGDVFDGPDLHEDIDYQSDIASLTIYYTGFESEAHGIEHTHVCVGTKPGWDDVVPYSSQGLIVEEGQSEGIIGLGGQGKWQTLTALSSGTKYHVTVKATTGAGNVLESSSDGVVPDITPSKLALNSLQGYSLNLTYDSTPLTLYIHDINPLTFAWDNHEPESRISNTDIAIGSYPGSCEFLENLDVSSLVLNAVPSGLIRLNTSEGGPNIVTLKSANSIGLVSSISGPSVIADSTPPTEGAVNCPGYIAPGGQSYKVTCTWSGFTDSESGIGSYKVGLGIVEGDDSVVAFSSVGEITHLVLSFEDSTNVTDRSFLVTVIAANNVGLETVAYSSAIWIDHTPPIPGKVIEMADSVKVNASLSSDVGDLCPGNTVCDAMDAVCQRTLTQVTIAWTPFEDPESSIIGYTIALGTTPGGSQIRDFTPVPGHHQYTTIHGLDLSDTRVVYATVKGYNGAGSYSASTSDGVLISRVSAGLLPLQQFHVWDGHQYGTDAMYQSDNVELAATWDFSGDPCLISKYEWEVRRFDGLVVLPMEELPDGQTYGKVDGLQMRDDESYYAVVRATNALGHVMTARSDGVTIRLEPLIPGHVRDGDVIGTDLAFWPYVDHLSANWGGFGTDREMPVNDISNDNPDVDMEIGEHQTIDYYEVALGSDRRYPSTRENIHPFINVGLNTTWTFLHLELVPVTGVYFFTVRAHSLARTTTEVTSNGIMPGHGAKVIANGELHVPRYSSSMATLEFSWSHFEFAVPMSSYIWAIGAKTPRLLQVLCTDMEIVTQNGGITPELSQMFRESSPVNVGTDTMVEAVGLSLTPALDYLVVLIAVDESGGCSMTSAEFTVDITPPVEGKLQLGDGLYKDKLVWYNPDENQLSVSWPGYVDLESGVAHFQLTLYDELHCSSPVLDQKMEETITLHHNDTEYVFLDIELKASHVYYVVLDAENGAGLKVTTISPPILLDTTSPIAGSTTNNLVFSRPVNYQSSMTSVDGSILYVPLRDAEPCPARNPLKYPKDAIFVKSQGITDIENPDALMEGGIAKAQGILRNERMTLNLHHDVKTEMMIGAAALFEADIVNGGSYKFEIKTAMAAFHPVTSVAWVEGSNANLFTDFLGNIFEEVHDSEPKEVTQTNYYGYTESTGFGFQIYSGVNLTSLSDHVVVVWCFRQNETWYGAVDLEFDPSADFHKYGLIINEDGYLPGDDWQISLHIDGKLKLAVYGGNPFDTDVDVSVQVGLYPRRSHVMPLDDKFNPPATSSVITALSFPPPSSSPCRYGQPFKGGDHPIVEFLAGVGREPGIYDVKSPVMVHQPCIPCLHPCDHDICDTNCHPDALQEISFTLSDVHLEALSTDDDLEFSNQTDLQAYYINVIGRTASGRQSSSASGAFYVDPSPPNITLIYHFDMDWDANEPVTFQGSNNTISCYWEALDIESGIVEYEWSIGTIPGGGDVQSFESVGQTTYADNSNLEGKLKDQTTYYVTVRARNAAGLWGYITSPGVTVSLVEPDMSDVPSNIDDAEPFPPNAKGNSVKTKSQDHIGVGWGRPHKNDNIEGIYVSVETEEPEADIFPQTMVGFNESGKLDLSADGIQIEGVEETGNMSDVIRRNKRDIGQLLLEPGRTVKPVIRACNKAHKCGTIPTSPLIIIRDEDKIATATGGVLSVSLAKAHIQANELAPDGLTLIAGDLSEVDMSFPYHSDASDRFTPYIVDPRNTKQQTNRIMQNRIVNWENEYFFLTTIADHPIEGGVQITIPFDPSSYRLGPSGEEKPRLMVWCARNELWIDASTTCTELTPAEQAIYDWDNFVLRIGVCDNHAACDHDQPDASRRRRSTPSQDYIGPAAFALARTLNTIQNSPPTVTSLSSINIEEDATLLFYLEAADPDDDRFVFVLDNTKPLPPGAINLQTDGELTYTPPENFYGTVNVHFEVIESGLAEVERTKSTLTIVINPVNDCPVLLLIKEGHAISESSNNFDFTIQQNRPNESAKSLEFLWIAYDVDKDDIVTIATQFPQNGTLELTSTFTNPRTEAQDCTRDWDDLLPLWYQLEQNLRLGNQGSIILPIPCNVPNAALNSVTSWSVTLAKFTPAEEFHGLDNIKAIGQDGDNCNSEIQQIYAYTLEFPCENNADCSGPSKDPDCTAINRAFGFFSGGYTCSCAPDYSGVLCESQIDDCLPDPCPNNFTCLDGVASHSCVCGDESWPCFEQKKTMDEWMIAVIAAVPVLLMIAAIILLTVACVKQRTKREETHHGKDTQPFMTASPSSLEGYEPKIMKASTVLPKYVSDVTFGKYSSPKTEYVGRKTNHQTPYTQPAGQPKRSRSPIQYMYERRYVDGPGMWESGRVAGPPSHVLPRADLHMRPDNAPPPSRQTHTREGRVYKDNPGFVDDDDNTHGGEPAPDYDRSGEPILMDDSVPKGMLSIPRPSVTKRL